jgi:fucose permease
VLPAGNAVLFSRVPIAPIVPEGQSMSVKDLLHTRLFWLLAFLMLCAGASEQAMSQWASAFAESALQVRKTVGDLAGPCFFSVLMGLSRVLHAKIADRIHLETYISRCALLCIGSYAMAVVLQSPALNLLGCGLCGFSVGVLWPGTFSMAADRCPLGGTAMFALLALAGDAGCSFGPTLVGLTSGMASDNLKIGLAFAVLFPLGILLGIRWLRLGRSRQE